MKTFSIQGKTRHTDLFPFLKETHCEKVNGKVDVVRNIVSYFHSDKHTGKFEQLCVSSEHTRKVGQSIVCPLVYIRINEEEDGKQRASLWLNNFLISNMKEQNKEKRPKLASDLQLRSFLFYYVCGDKQLPH